MTRSAQQSRYPGVVQDEYGQEVGVNLCFGSRGVTVDLGWEIDEGTHPASTRVKQTSSVVSSLKPDKARELAKQLETAAEEAERYG